MGRTAGGFTPYVGGVIRIAPVEGIQGYRPIRRAGRFHQGYRLVIDAGAEVGILPLLFELGAECDIADEDQSGSGNNDFHDGVSNKFCQGHTVFAVCLPLKTYQHAKIFQCMNQFSA